MDHFDEKMKDRAAKESTPVPEGFEARLAETLARLSEKKRRKFGAVRWVVVAACLCLLLAGAGFAAVYGMWATYNHDLTGSNVTLKQYCNDLELPERLGEYSFNVSQSLYIVPHGVSFTQAFFSPIYRAMEFTYRNDELDANGNSIIQRELTIGIGKTDVEYWSAYFGYDPETLEHIPQENGFNFHTVEYQGYTVYVYDWVGPESGVACPHATWLDKKRGICFAVYLHDTEESLLNDIMPYVEMVIGSIASATG